MYIPSRAFKWVSEARSVSMVSTAQSLGGQGSVLSPLLFSLVLEALLYLFLTFEPYEFLMSTTLQ